MTLKEKISARDRLDEEIQQELNAIKDEYYAKVVAAVKAYEEIIGAGISLRNDYDGTPMELITDDEDKLALL